MAAEITEKQQNPTIIPWHPPAASNNGAIVHLWLCLMFVGYTVAQRSRGKLEVDYISDLRAIFLYPLINAGSLGKRCKFSL